MDIYSVNFYKKKSALRFKTLKINDSPAVFFEIAAVLDSSGENPTFDWNNKIIFSLSMDELGKIINYYNPLNGEREEALNFIHKTEKATKSLKLAFVGDKSYLTINSQVGEDTSKINFLLLNNEVLILLELIKSSILIMAEATKWHKD